MMIVASSKYNTTADIYWTVASIGGGGGTTIGASYLNIYDFGEVDNTGETGLLSIMRRPQHRADYFLSAWEFINLII